MHVNVLAVCMCPDAHVLMVAVCVVCMNLAGRAVDADQSAHVFCVCAAECQKWAEHRWKFAHASCCSQGMRRCAECGRMKEGLGQWQTEQGRCAQIMRHCADCGRLQGGCGRLQTKHGQVRTTHCQSHDIVIFARWELPGALWCRGHPARDVLPNIPVLFR